VTAQQPQIYEPDVTEKLFASANEREFILFQTFLMPGFRDQEIGFPGLALEERRVQPAMSWFIKEQQWHTKQSMQNE
jgi:hypothetical protein